MTTKIIAFIKNIQ